MNPVASNPLPGIFLHGIGGTAFGVSIRYISFSLTYAIAGGLSSVLGTLIPPLVRGTLGVNLSKPGGAWLLMGVVIGTLDLEHCVDGARRRRALAHIWQLHR